MARFHPDPQVTALGEALAALRRESGLSQAEAGARAGMTSQGWGLYEGGRRPGLFRPDVQRRLTEALGVTPEDLALTLAARSSSVPDSPASSVRSPGRGFKGTAASRAPALERMSLSTDELAPWAVSGVVLEFDAGRWPRRDQGCVIDLKDGSRIVRIYVGADADHLHLRGGPGGLDSATSLDRSTVARVATVRARLDE
ncbi:transcriptional regulator [Brevundimonas sp. LM2]|uniref:helix-turn-helix domain-containing protein n=1 Tax=Brevundimonas sp. LM2 TaxID=1938605 RepID=UPI000983B5B4|nr:helix-turn-helix transcriptional regulator [Brevundimonas sp. LM2]AQR60452.1 transcriptional regulator [Brevundimonas sp. LM2]